MSDSLSKTTPIKRVNILGIDVAKLDVERLHQMLLELIEHESHELILHVNVHGLNVVYSDPQLRSVFSQAAVTFCDGIGVILGARILGHHIPQRITYADWMWQLAEFAETHEFTFFFLGARPGVAEKAVQRLHEQFPNLRIVGTHHGYFDKTLGSTENEAIIRRINEVNPNILLVGFGMPMQERWLMENWHRIDANIALTGGAVFDYISGELRRGPRWMTDHGLEWLARFVIEPWRLWRRYLIGNPLFLWRVLMQRFGLLRIR